MLLDTANLSEHSFGSTIFNLISNLPNEAIAMNWFLDFLWIFFRTICGDASGSLQRIAQHLEEKHALTADISNKALPFVF